MGNIEILFLRHGNAGPADRDFDKPLSEKGREQAEARKSKLNFVPDVVLASPAARTDSTAMVVFGHVDGVLPELYLGMDDAERARQSGNFKKVGNSPIKKFLEIDPEHYERYGLRGAKAIREVAFESLRFRSERKAMIRVAVVGHGPLLCAMARKLTNDPAVLNIVLEEAEGFIVRADGSVELLKG